MALRNGDKLGPYEITARLGAGGMGEVYRARDPRLGRDVAIKVSTEKFSERFQHEANRCVVESFQYLSSLRRWAGLSRDGTRRG